MKVSKKILFLLLLSFSLSLSGLIGCTSVKKSCHIRSSNGSKLQGESQEQ